MYNFLVVSDSEDQVDITWLNCGSAAVDGA